MEDAPVPETDAPPRHRATPEMLNAAGCTNAPIAAKKDADQLTASLLRSHVNNDLAGFATSPATSAKTAL